jgi:hypothetical protein
MPIEPIEPEVGRSRASVRIWWACAGLIAAAVVPHRRCAARATSVASDADRESADVPAVWPSPNSVCSTVCPTASSAAIPGSERSRPASGATTRNVARKPAPSVHSGTVAQEAIA